MGFQMPPNAQIPMMGNPGLINPGAPMLHQQNAQSKEKMNFALEFLDRVKVAYSHQPDVYNQFLDIMKEFKNHR